MIIMRIVKLCFLWSLYLLVKMKRRELEYNNYEQMFKNGGSQAA
jgi:hypothetical protein